ncbi:MAG: S1C family serine protease [Saprospiraceae bacterium]
MKNPLSYFAVAMLSSLMSFFIFQALFSQDAALLTSEEYAAAQLVNEPAPVRVNTSPVRTYPNNSVDFRMVSKSVTPSVVNVTALNSAGYRASSGSGVVLSSDGYIVTNHHVIENSAKVEITLSDKRELIAKVVGFDLNTDLALLKIEARNLIPAQYGNSDQVEVGEWVLAVGNPFNLTSTVTAGIVSAKARNINILGNAYAIESFIQTDAVVNPGNSGGALVNTRGELIGINTAIITERGGYEGYSFAIPANLVKKVVEDIRQFGSVRRAILGVQIQEVDGVMASRLGLPSATGAYISRVYPSSSAESAGLLFGDVITTINDVAISSMPELQEQVGRYRPGDLISLEYYRSGKKYRRDNVKLKAIEQSSAMTD